MTSASHPPELSSAERRLNAEQLFGQWTQVIYDQLQFYLAQAQPALTLLGVPAPEDPGAYAAEVYCAAADPEDWRMEIHFPSAGPVNPIPRQWQHELEAIVLPAIEPLRELLPTLGVNDYLFEGCNVSPEAVLLPIEPYGDAAITAALRRLMQLPAYNPED